MNTCLYQDVGSELSDLAQSQPGATVRRAGRGADSVVPVEAVSAGTALNLQQWIDRRTLLSWIRLEIERFVPLSLGQAFMAPNAVDRFRKMLTLLSLAYSTGMTRSAEIGEACHRNAEYSAIAGDFCPFADELRSFRRRYRAVLEVVLTRLFMRAAALNAQFAREAVPRELESQFESRAKEVLNRARHLDAVDDW